MTDDLPHIERYVRSNGGQSLDEECSECDGPLYKFGEDVICTRCSLIVSGGGVGTDDVSDPYSNDLYRLSSTNRSVHNNSDVPRCAGGFIHPYEWNNDNDILSFYE